MIGKIVIGLIGCLVGSAIGICFSISQIVKPTVKELKKSRELSSKHLKLYMLMNDWVTIKQNGVDFEKYFIDNGYNRIAIYGMNYVGKALQRELSKTSVEIVVGIDQAGGETSGSTKIVMPNEFNEVVDAIIVTPITYFDDIAEMMEQKTKASIISMEDIIYDLIYNVNK